MISKVHSGAEDGEPAAKKQKTIESETKSVKKEMAFVSLAETLKVTYICIIWQFMFSHQNQIMISANILGGLEQRAVLEADS